MSAPLALVAMVGPGNGSAGQVALFVPGQPVRTARATTGSDIEGIVWIQVGVVPCLRGLCKTEIPDTVHGGSGRPPTVQQRPHARLDIAGSTVDRPFSGSILMHPLGF